MNCKQLTKDMVQPLMAGTIDSVTVTAAGDDDTGQQCDFAGGADDVSDIDVLVLSGSTATAEYSNIASGGISVPGVGDKAVRPDGDVSLDALHGDTYCSVSVGDPGDLPGIGAFEAANEGSTDIPDSVLDPAAAALGTLCNRIFGSGNTTPDLAALAAAVASAQAALAERRANVLRNSVACDEVVRRHPAAQCALIRRWPSRPAPARADTAARSPWSCRARRSGCRTRTRRNVPPRVPRPAPWLPTR